MCFFCCCFFSHEPHVVTYEESLAVASLWGQLRATQVPRLTAVPIPILNFLGSVPELGVLVCVCVCSTEWEGCLMAPLASAATDNAELGLWGLWADAAVVNGHTVMSVLLLKLQSATFHMLEVYRKDHSPCLFVSVQCRYWNYCKDLQDSVNTFACWSYYANVWSCSSYSGHWMQAPRTVLNWLRKLPTLTQSIHFSSDIMVSIA